jgi:hypothetical protein
MYYCVEKLNVINQLKFNFVKIKRIMFIFDNLHNFYSFNNHLIILKKKPHSIDLYKEYHNKLNDYKNKKNYSDNLLNYFIYLIYLK